MQPANVGNQVTECVQLLINTNTMLFSGFCDVHGQLFKISNVLWFYFYFKSMLYPFFISRAPQNHISLRPVTPGLLTYLHTLVYY